MRSASVHEIGPLLRRRRRERQSMPCVVGGLAACLNTTIGCLQRARDALEPSHVEWTIAVPAEDEVPTEDESQLVGPTAGVHPDRVQRVHARAIELLSKIFPVEEVAELFHSGGARAKVHENATLLFADMVGFTAWSARHTPDRIFDALTRYYQLLDM